MVDLNELGARIRDAYATSFTEGRALWMGYVGEIFRVYHVPAAPGDGELIPPEVRRQGGGSENLLADRVKARITVHNYRVSGDDMLIMETTFSGELRDGQLFAFPFTLVFTLRDGEIERILEIGSSELYGALRAALEQGRATEAVAERGRSEIEASAAAGRDG